MNNAQDIRKAVSNEVLAIVQNIEEADRICAWAESRDLKPLLLSTDVRVSAHLRRRGHAYVCEWDYSDAEMLHSIRARATEATKHFVSDFLHKRLDIQLDTMPAVSGPSYVWIFCKLFAEEIRLRQVFERERPHMIVLASVPSRPMTSSMDYGDNDLAAAVALMLAEEMGIEVEILKSDATSELEPRLSLSCLRKLWRLGRAFVRRCWNLLHLASGVWARTVWDRKKRQGYKCLLFVGDGSDAAHLSIFQAGRPRGTNVHCQLVSGSFLSEMDRKLAYGAPISRVPGTCFWGRLRLPISAALPTSAWRSFESWRQQCENAVPFQFSLKHMDFQFRSMLEAAYRAEFQVQHTERQLAVVQPDAVMTTFTNCFVVAARRLGIKTLILQHGFDHWHPYAIKMNYGRLTFCWGSSMRRKMIEQDECDPDDLVPTGNVMMDPQFRYAVDMSAARRRTLRAKFELSETSRVICIPSAGYWAAHHDMMINSRQYIEGILAVAHLAREAPSLQFVLKTHPRGDDARFYVQLFADEGALDQLRIVFNATLSEVLLASDVVLMVNCINSGMLDAWIVGLPVVWLTNGCSVEHFRRTLPGCSGETMLTVDDVTKLADALHAVSRPGAERDRWVEAGRRFMREYIAETDGHAVERTWNTVLKMYGE